MKTSLLSAYCADCGYRNSYRTDRKDRRRILRVESWPGLVWQCESCGKEFESEIRWIRIRFEDWAAFWLYYRRFDWKVLGVAFFLACGLFAAGGFYFASYLPEWFQTLVAIAVAIGIGAGFLLLGEIPHAYHVYVVNNQRGAIHGQGKRIGHYPLSILAR